MRGENGGAAEQASWVHEMLPQDKPRMKVPIMWAVKRFGGLLKTAQA
jgi:hypothetical protein